MPTIRVSLFLWTDYSGNVIAAPIPGDLLPGECRFAFAATADEAVKRLKAALTFHVGRIVRETGRPPEIEPVWTNRSAGMDIQTAKIRVRARYRRENREFPMAEFIELRLPMTVARDDDGIVYCTLPTLDVAFQCFYTDDVQAIVNEQAREIFKEAEPNDVLASLPPRNWSMQTVRVHFKAAGRETTEPEYPALRRAARALGETSLRKRFTPAFRREEQVAALSERLTDSETNLALVGPAGAGRMTLLAAAVRAAERRYREEEKSREESNRSGVPHRFWLTSARRLVAGARYLGEWQEQVESIVEELASFDGVLCVENLVELTRVGGPPTESVAAFLVPYMENGQIRLVGRATPREMDALRRMLPGFADKFETARVEPMDVTEAARALELLAARAARDLDLEIEPEVPATAVRLFKRFQPYLPLPGRASGFLLDLADRARRNKTGRLTAADATGAFVRETGLPEWLLRDEETLRYKDVVEKLSARVVGQEAACREAAQAVVQFKAAMNHPGRPIASMLFCGPTGVGKTQLAKTLRDLLFGADVIGDAEAGTAETRAAERFTRLDMSEYATPYSAERLLEKPDGTPSELVRRIRRRPFSVVLLDEVEKADGEVFDVLLGLFDEGRLTDRFGRTTDFRSTIVIMTSNLGTAGGRSMSFSPDESTRLLKAVYDFFRPEFFNRIDAVVPFVPLSKEICRRIVAMELSRLETRERLAEHRLHLEATRALIDHLLDTGFDLRFGARPLQRAVESEVIPVVARRLLEAPVERGATLGLDWEGGEVKAKGERMKDEG